MASVETLNQLAVDYWSGEDQCFVCDCPLIEKVVGTGQTAEQARTSFEEILESALKHLTDASLMDHGRSGRPKNKRVSINVQVLPETKVLIDEITGLLGISQGELIDVATYAQSKRIKRRMPKLLLVSPPRQVIPVLAHNDGLKSGGLFVFKTGHSKGAQTLASMLRWEPNQPWHFRWFDEFGMPTDFLATTKEVLQLSHARQLSEITLEVRSVPKFAQKVSDDDIGWAQRELAYIEATENDQRQDGVEKCDCKCVGAIDSWGCAKCPLCGPAYMEIQGALSKLRPNGVSVEKFSKRYGDIELVWNNPAESNFPFIAVSGKSNGRAYSGALSGAHCELMLKGVSNLPDFCSDALLRKK